MYSELSWVYESIGDCRKALDWARAARGAFAKTSADAAARQVRTCVSIRERVPDRRKPVSSLCM